MALLKEYRNGEGGNWNVRIRWYDSMDGTVKLVKETPEGTTEMKGLTQDDAKVLYADFKKKYPHQRRK